MSLLSRRRALMSTVFAENITILPEIYQEVEFIQSTGTQFIDTDFIPNQDTGVYLDFQLMEIYGSFLFGTRIDTGTQAYTFNISGGNFVTVYGTKIMGFISADTNRHIYIREKNIARLDHIRVNNSVQTFNAPYSLLLLATNQQNNYGYLPSKAKVYSFKIYDNETLIRDFIPCYRKSDNVAGMYDIANNKFYTNAGTGDFIVGDDVSYEKVNYIESTGTQYIDTGVIPNQNTGFDVVYVTNDKLVGGNVGYGAILGARESSKVNELQLTTYTQDNSGFSGTLRFGNTDNNAGISAEAKMHSTLKNRVYTNNFDTTYELNDITFVCPVPLTIFALNNNGAVTQFGKVKLYSLKIYDGNSLLRDFIPCCRINDNTFGLYDKIEKKLYTNAGTGDFIVGGNV